MNIVVVGGGTAGWITALFCKKIFPQHNISLIESEDIGIIGVGEATTPHIVSMLQQLEIDIVNLIKNCNGSIKNGINFENWNGDGKKYFHSFQDNLVDFKVKNLFNTDCFDFYLKALISKNLSMNEYIYSAHLAYNNKIDLRGAAAALHFDASMLADYLKRIGIERGIEHINGNINEIKTNKDGLVKEIVLKEGRKVKTNFVFDCSGFHRLIIGKFYKQKWISYSKHLPMKKAIPFWLDNEEVIQPYTSAIAMKYGWMWKIPLQHRIGSGYIFDSDYIDVDQALDEAQKYYKRNLDIRKIIPFEAGRFENLWVKNVIAVGLSSSFIEPLESTSLFLSVQQLETFKQFANEIERLDERSISLFNTIVKNNMEDILCFVYLHYITKRKDSEFWKTFKEKYPPPEKLNNLLDSIKSNNLRYFDFLTDKNTARFPQSSYLQVCYGLEMFDKKINVTNQNNLDPSIEEYKKLIDIKVAEALDVKTFLEKTNLMF
jgi:tryptophan halogenase